MYSKTQTVDQMSSPEGCQANSSFPRAQKQELGLTEEKEDVNLLFELNKKSATHNSTIQNTPNDFSSFGQFDFDAGFNEQIESGYFEKILKGEQPRDQTRKYDSFGHHFNESSAKTNIGSHQYDQLYKKPVFEENKADLQRTQADNQYSYLNAFFQSNELNKGAESGFEQSGCDPFFGIPVQNQPVSPDTSKPFKSASDEKILRKVMGKVAGPRNLQLPAQGAGYLSDRRPATTRPALRHVWNYQSSSKLKTFESLVGPEEEEEDAENDEDEEALTRNYRRNTVTDSNQYSQKQIIDAIPKILAKNPLIMNNIQERDAFDISDKHDDFESEGSTAKSFSGNPNNRSSVHHTSGEVWEGGTPSTTPRLSQGFIGYHPDLNVNYASQQQLQEGIMELQKSGFSGGGYDTARRTSNQLSNDNSINRSYDGWNLKHTPTKTNNQLIKKSSLSFISSDSEINNNLNNSFNTHFSANSHSKKYSYDIQMNEFPKNMSMNSQIQQQQPFMGFNNQINPNVQRQVIQEQRLTQQQQQQQHHFEQMQQQKFERSHQFHQTPKRSGYNLNQSAILFGNTFGTPMNSQLIQSNWNMHNNQMDQMNHSFNLMNLHTSRENMMYGSQQNFNLNQSMTLPTRASYQEQNYANTQRNEQNQKAKNIGSHQKIKGKGSKKGGENEDREFEIDLRNIEQVHKTTLMIRNIPNKYDQNLLLQTINKNHKGKFDFLYLPIDFKNKCNVGYAFINFIKNTDIREFYMEFNGKKWDKFNSEKIAQITYARIQGLKQLIHHFKSSNVMNQQDKKMKPVVLSNSTRQTGGPEIIQNIQSIEELIKQQKEKLNKPTH